MRWISGSSAASTVALSSSARGRDLSRAQQRCRARPALADLGRTGHQRVERGCGLEPGDGLRIVAVSEPRKPLDVARVDKDRGDITGLPQEIDSWKRAAA